MCQSRWIPERIAQRLLLFYRKTKENTIGNFSLSETKENKCYFPMDEDNSTTLSNFISHVK